MLPTYLHWGDKRTGRPSRACSLLHLPILGQPAGSRASLHELRTADFTSSEACHLSGPMISFLKEVSI